MARQFFRKVEPYDQNPNSNWIMMSGKEFYRFIISPEARGGYFIKWDDLVIEASRDQYLDWLCDEEHSGYLRQHENGWNTLSLYSDIAQENVNGEELVADTSVNVELSAMRNIRQDALTSALHQLDSQSFYLIYSIYLADSRKTEHEFAIEIGITQQAVHKRKEKILKQLKFLVVKFEKSPQ